MGLLSLSCCFKNIFPNPLAFASITSNMVGIIFLIWGATELKWYWFRKARKPLYIISFVFFFLTLIGLIFVIVLLNLWTDQNFIITINIIGKILCGIIIGLCILAFIFLLIAEILILKDYNHIENELGPGRNIPILDWLRAIIPGISGLITLVITTLCVNVLYKKFNDNILAQQNNNSQSAHVNQDSTLSVEQKPDSTILENASGNIKQ